MEQNEGQHPHFEAPVEPDLGRWKIKRNIHYWIIAIVAVVLITFLTIETMQSENPDDAELEALRAQREKEVAALNRTDRAPSREELQRLIDEQQKAADAERKAQDVPESAKLPVGLLPALPSGTTRPNTGLPTPQAMKGNEPDQEAQNAARREEQIAASAIMAIDRSAKGVVGTNLQAMSPVAGNDTAQNKDRKRDEMYQKMLAQSGAMAGTSAAPRKSGSRQGSDELFIESMSEERTSLNDVIRPISARGTYALMQGAIIPSVLITEIRSDLPGELKAQTTMDVYDSVNGEVLLIPKGSVLVGKYNSEVRIGQEKVMAGFTRLIFPSGASVDLGGMKAAAANGESGLADDVDNHFFKMFGANFLIAGLAQVFQNNSDSSTTVNSYGTTNVSNTAGDVLADTVRVINQRNVSIPPTIYVYRGHKFNVMVNKDMVLPPYQTGVRQ